jgi:hypothetical protein
MGALVTLAALFLCVGIGAVAIRAGAPQKSETSQPISKDHLL